MAEMKSGPGAGSENPRSASLIQHYEEIADASRSMLEAAHAGDWAAVEAIEARCRELIVALKQAAVAAALSGSEKRRRLALLRSILQNDAQVRMRAEPWLLDLENFLTPPHRSANHPR
jgi:flagellar protein FliT